MEYNSVLQYNTISFPCCQALLFEIVAERCPNCLPSLGEIPVLNHLLEAKVMGKGSRDRPEPISCANRSWGASLLTSLFLDKENQLLYSRFRSSPKGISLPSEMIVV